MQELLKRWAGLEPGRCEKNREITYTIWTEPGAAKQVHNPDELSQIDLAWIQWAVQQAIVARGWSFELKYNPDSPDPRNPYDATVDSNKSGGWGFGNDGFTVPLLEAYLHTLEGEVKK